MGGGRLALHHPLPDHRFCSLPSSRRSNPHLSPTAPFNTILYSNFHLKCKRHTICALNTYALVMRCNAIRYHIGLCDTSIPVSLTRNTVWIKRLRLRSQLRNSIVKISNNTHLLVKCTVGGSTLWVDHCGLESIV